MPVGMEDWRLSSGGRSEHDHDRVGRVVARAKAGDRDALRVLYMRYAATVRSAVRPLVGSEHDAEDVTQQVFLKLMTVISRYERREVSFLAWLLRVARNVALDHLRQRRAVPAADVHRAEDLVDDGDRLRAGPLREALQTLPEDQRAVVVLRHVFGMSPPEIARLLGRTEASVHGLHHRGRASVKRALVQNGAAPVARRSITPSNALAA